MKRLLFLLSFLMASSFLWAQTVPQGINYQAVLRHASGQIISDKPVSVKVTILNVDNDYHYYEEVHQVTSSAEGVVQMVIGAGTHTTGSFQSIPWSVAKLWANIAYDIEGRGHYESIGVMQLLSVPYAFYAETAGKAMPSDDGAYDEEGGDRNNAEIIEKFWKTSGNELLPISLIITEPEHVLDNQHLLPQFLGTTNFMPLQIKTDDTLRAFMLPLGDFYLLKNQFIYGGLDVKGDVLFHEDLIAKGRIFSEKAELFNLVVLNDARINNNLQVGNDLDVFGISRFNNTTQSTTKDDGSIIIEGGVGIEKNVNIGGNTEIDGTLGVDGITTFNNTTQSTTKDNGAVVVEGGIGIEKNLNVGGNAALGGTLDIGGQMTINDATQSTATNNGALVVVGGVGIGKNLNVGGALGVANMSPTTLTGTLTVDKATDLNSTLNVDGASTLNSSLTVDGSTTLNSTLAANGQVTINALVTGGDNSYNAYPLRVQGSQQGIAIQLNPEFPNETNNFITFFGSGTNNSRGRIEGQTGLTGIARDIAISIVGDEPSENNAENNTSKNKNQDPQENATYQQYFGSNYAFAAINHTVDFVYTIVVFAVNLVACLAGVAVFGDCDDIVWATMDLIKTGAQLVALIAVNEANIGVTYESGGADYAEWMCRFDSLETIAFGEIVGMKGGKISKTFETAERYMVISDKPGVLGAMPEAGKEHLYEKIAFMGQVPVKVMGDVQIGDYILPSGKGDGMGIAVHPDKVLINDYKRIIGVAWSASKPKTLVNYINTAVGLHQNQLAGVVEQMQSVMNEMQLALQRLSPEYQATYFETSGNKPSNQQITQITESEFERQLRINQEANHYANVQEQLADVKAYAESVGFNFSDYPLLNQLMENPTKENAEAVTAYYTKALERGQQMLAEAQKHKRG